ncbi:MAG: hypothetical protein KA712_01055 [Myxococcales bacterium]|nr:hypothetical protein [Myxococcales bacterium]
MPVDQGSAGVDSEKSAGLSQWPRREQRARREGRARVRAPTGRAGGDNFFHVELLPEEVRRRYTAGCVFLHSELEPAAPAFFEVACKLEPCRARG